MKHYLSTLNCLLSVILLAGCSSSTHTTLNESAKPINNGSLWPVSNLTGIESEDIFTFTCEIIEQKPTTSTANCADFGESIFHIKWRKWSTTGASGIGIYSINDCIPDCSAGTRHQRKVEVKLDGIYTNGTKYFFTHLTFKSTEKLPLSDSKTGGWDTSEFYLSLSSE